MSPARAVTRRLLAGCGLTALITASGNAMAGAFYIPQQSVASVGRAFAGESAIADDASTVFHNPAGMTALAGPAFDAGVNLLMLSFDVRDQGSTATTAGSGFTPLPIAPGAGSTPSTLNAVPNLYAAYPVLEQRLWLGIGLAFPFGLSNQYPDSWFGRYDSIKTRLTTLNIGPSVAYKVTRWLSIGAGLDIGYADATLTNALPAAFNPGVPVPATDGLAEATGSDWSVGYNVGFLLTPRADTRLGLHFRSAMDYDLAGSLAISRLAAPLNALNAATPASTTINLPWIASFAASHDLSPAFKLLAEVKWFGWSRFQDITIQPAGLPDIVRPQRYSDSVSVSIGGEYRPAPAWTLRAGFMYDQTPIPDAFRSTSIPTGDAWWLGVGATYQPLDRLAVTVSYAHTFFDDVPINAVSRPYAGVPVPALAATSITTRGTAAGAGDTVSISVRYRF